MSRPSMPGRRAPSWAARAELGGALMVALSLALFLLRYTSAGVAFCAGGTALWLAAAVSYGLSRGGVKAAAVRPRVVQAPKG